jgi:predicted Zn-dependent protease
MENKMKTYLVGLTAFLSLIQTAMGTTKMPEFLPGYYSPAFTVGSKQLIFVNETDVNGVDTAFYATEDGSLALSVESIKCDTPGCKALINNSLNYFNTLMKSNPGRFVEITDSEVYVELVQDKASQYIFVYALPSSVQVWTYGTAAPGNEQIAPMFKLIRSFANRRRYNKALSEGNIEMGHWGSQIHDYANQLFAQGSKAEALAVLKNLLATSPYDFAAHMDFIKNTDDSAAAAESARIVFKNAEDRKLIEETATYLKKDLADLNSIPLLSANETGLQLILVPLPPCNPWLLDEAAATFQQITNVPVKIRRIKENWVWASPERISRQRMIQSMLVQMKGANIDFTGWTKDRYIEEMRSAAETKDALAKYWVNDLIKKIADEPGQYFVDPYADRFCDIITSYGRSDYRTMYVGITEANIYSGDNNYVFSVTTEDKNRAGILSYYMMLGKTLGEEYESRRRLTERIAKELVPASLKQLGIPRSMDPSCPYSYSSGVDRLDQKTLKLAEPVKVALEKLNYPIKVKPLGKN